MTKTTNTPKLSILGMVDYNKPTKFEFKHPVNGAGLGVFREHLLQPDISQKIAGNERLTIGMQVARERIAAAIVGWDFNGNVLDDGDEKEPELNLPNKLKLLSKDWIYKQLDAQVCNLSNFMKR